MQESDKSIKNTTLTIGAPALVAGLSIGWMVGLAVSPVVGSVLAGLLGIVGGVGAGLTTVIRDREKSAASLNLWPVALLCLGIAVGSSGGVYARGQGWLASDDPERRDSKEGSGSLFSATSKGCVEIRKILAGGIGIHASVRSQFGEAGKELANHIEDPETLSKVMGTLCQTR